MLILLHDQSWGRFLLKTERPNRCSIINDLNRLPEAQAVIFHIPTAPKLNRLKKRPGQRWIAFSMESDVNYPQQRNHTYMSAFDLTMTYHWDSDVPATYLGPHIRSHLALEPVAKTAAAPAACFVSNSRDKCLRYEFTRELMRHMNVHSYGKSLRNRKLVHDYGDSSKMETIARHKFTFAFENSIAHDYVTEKFFQPLIVGSVPVYRGAPNVDEFAPGQSCFINAAQFRNPAELAKYLNYLDQHEREYESYLEWKRKPLLPAFLAKAEKVSEPVLSRLCRRLHETS